MIFCVIKLCYTVNLHILLIKAQILKGLKNVKRMVQNVWRHRHFNCQQAPIAATRLRFQGCPENVKITKSFYIYKDIFWELVASIILQRQTDVI